MTASATAQTHVAPTNGASHSSNGALLDVRANLVGAVGVFLDQGSEDSVYWIENTGRDGDTE